MTERRTFASRFYRFTLKREVRYVAVLSLVLGWSLIAYAAGAGVAEGDTTFNLALLGGGMLLAFGLIGGTTRWIAVPASDRVMTAHMKMGSKSHPEFVTRDEWHAKHIELLERINKVHEDMIDELRACVKHNREDRR